MKVNYKLIENLLAEAPYRRGYARDVGSYTHASAPSSYGWVDNAINPLSVRSEPFSGTPPQRPVSPQVAARWPKDWTVPVDVQFGSSTPQQAFDVPGRTPGLRIHPDLQTYDQNANRVGLGNDAPASVYDDPIPGQEYDWSMDLRRLGAKESKVNEEIIKKLIEAPYYPTGHIPGAEPTMFKGRNPYTTVQGPEYASGGAPSDKPQFGWKGDHYINILLNSGFDVYDKGSYQQLFAALRYFEDLYT